jgi:hypothetical protein
MTTAPQHSEITAEEVAATVDGHLAAYAEPDADRRAEAIARVWAEDGQLIDPPLTGEGHRGIDAAAGVLLTHYAGHTFRRTTGVDVHHGHFRYAWELVGPDGTVAVAGVDVGEVAGDGRLRRITGFFGDPPAREAA